MKKLFASLLFLLGAAFAPAQTVEVNPFPVDSHLIQIPAIAGGGVTSFNTRTGAVVLSAIDVNNTSQFGALRIVPSSYGVVADGKVCYGNTGGCGVTISSHTVTCSGCNFTSADVGKDIFATNGCCGSSSSYQGTLILARTTIASITNSTTVVANGTAATASCTTTCIIIYGTNDDTAWSAAESAWGATPPGTCATLFVPVGLSLVRTAHFNTIGSSCTGQVPEVSYSSEVRGFGKGASLIVIEPDFSFASCTFGPNSKGCFFSYKEATVKSLGLFGGGYGNTGSNNNNLISPDLGSEFFDFGCSAFGGSDSALVGFSTFQGSRLLFVSLDGCGRQGLSINTGIPSLCYFCFVGDTLAQNLVVNVGAIFYDYGSQYGKAGGTIELEIDGSYNAYSMQCFSNTADNGTCMYVNGTSAVVFLNGSQVVNNCANNCNGLFTAVSGAKVSAIGTTFTGKGTGHSISLTSGSTFTDLGGNAISTSPGTSGAGFIGQASAIGTALATGNLVLSANWGTGAATSVFQGRNSPVAFTLTNGSAAVGASPTITYTFPTPYTLAPLWCTATQIGGTNPLGTFAAGTPSATSIVFTYSATPVVLDTETVQVTCATQ